MKKEEFAEKVLKELKNRVGENIRVELDTVEKNNGVQRLGIAVRYSELNIGPCIYLEEYYAACHDGRITETEAVEYIYRELIKQKDTLVDFDVAAFQDWETIKCRISARLVNTEWNREWLKTKPYREFLDFAILYHINVESADGKKGTILVNNDHLKIWNKTEADLYDTAVTNMKKDTVFDKYPYLFPEDLLSGDEKGAMYLLSNTDIYYGAIKIIDHEMLEEISEQIGDFVMLPSSTHEWFLRQDDGIMDYEELVCMVKEINSSCCIQEERLSDHVYVYRKAEGEVRRAA